MPKFTYSAAKGIEQSSGSGFIIQNVPISRSVLDSGTAGTGFDSSTTALTDTEEVIHVNIAGAHTISIADGSTVGEQRVVVIGTSTGDDLDIGTASSEVTLADGTFGAGAVALLIWTGSAWALLS